MKEIMGYNEEEYDLRYAFNSISLNNSGNKRIIVIIDITGITDTTNYFPNHDGAVTFRSGPHTLLLSSNAIISFITDDEIEGYRLATNYFLNIKRYKTKLEKYFFNDIDPVGIGSAMLIQDHGNKAMYNIPVQIDFTFNYKLFFENKEATFDTVKIVSKFADKTQKSE